MKYLRKFNESNEIDAICEEYEIISYSINTDGSIDVDENVSLANLGLTKIPLKFNRVSGIFYCHYNKLTSLEGAPKYVGEYFNCSYNQLTNMEGAPKEIDGDFDCYQNKLISLVGSPKEVGGDFNCSTNKLTSLEGSPQVVNGNFYCSTNKLINLIGSPKEVGGDFYCMGNKLSSLKGSPKYVGGYFGCDDNPLPKEILDNMEYINKIVEWQDDYFIWEPDGSLDKFRFEDLMGEILGTEIRDINEGLLGDTIYHGISKLVPKGIRGRISGSIPNEQKKVLKKYGIKSTISDDNTELYFYHNERKIADITLDHEKSNEFGSWKLTIYFYDSEIKKTDQSSNIDLGQKENPYTKGSKYFVNTDMGVDHLIGWWSTKTKSGKSINSDFKIKF